MRMADLARRLVWLVHERQVEATLHTRILGALEGVLVRAGRLAEHGDRPPAIAFVDLSGYTSMTVERGDEAAAMAAERLRNLAEEAVRRWTADRQGPRRRGPPPVPGRRRRDPRDIGPDRPDRGRGRPAARPMRGSPPAGSWSATATCSARR